MRQTDRRTDEQTDEQTNRWTSSLRKARALRRRLNNFGAEYAYANQSKSSNAIKESITGRHQYIVRCQQMELASA